MPLRMRARYFAVPDVGSVQVRGLRGRTYADNAAGGNGARIVEESDGVGVVGEVDRVYYGAPDELTIVAPGRGELEVRSAMVISH